MDWYIDRGCTQPGRIAVGLISQDPSYETTTASLTQQLFHSISQYDVWEIDIWVNLWGQENTTMLWKPYLTNFINSGNGTSAPSKSPTSSSSTSTSPSILTSGEIAAIVILGFLGIVLLGVLAYLLVNKRFNSKPTGPTTIEPSSQTAAVEMNSNF